MSTLLQPTRAATTPAPLSPRLRRLGGLAGLAFAAGLFVQNVILLSGSPLPSAGLDEVAAYYTDESLRVAIATGWVAINLPFALLFVHVAAARLAVGEEGALWGRLARAAVVLLGALFGVTTILQATLAGAMPSLAADPAVLALAWSLHGAAFALGGAGLGILLGALSLGARHVPLVPRWMVPVGLAGALLCIAGAAGIVDVVRGGPSFWLLMAGFATWVAFLVTASVRLLRGDA